MQQEPTASHNWGIYSPFYTITYSSMLLELCRIVCMLQLISTCTIQLINVLDISVRTLRNKLNLYKEKELLPSEFILGEEILDKV